MGSQEGSTGPGRAPGDALLRGPGACWRAYILLKPICWDPKDFKDLWKRLNTLRWLSKKLAVPHRTESWMLKHRSLCWPQQSEASGGMCSPVAGMESKCGAWSARWWRTGSPTATCVHRPTGLTCACTCLLFSNTSTLLMAAHICAGVSMWNLMAIRDGNLHIRDELPSADLTARP